MPSEVPCEGLRDRLNFDSLTLLLFLLLTL